MAGREPMKIRRWIEPQSVETVFLDAGNTLVFLDHRAISEVLQRSRVYVSPSSLERAEYVARQKADRKYRQGESRDTHMWELYFSWLLDSAGAPSAVIPELLEAIREEHRRSNLWRSSHPDIAAALARLKASGRKLVVISNSDGTCRELLRRVNLLQYLDAVYDSTEVGVEKPAPEIFERALRETASRPAATIHLGDLEAVDVLGAQRVGIQPVLIDPFLERVRDYIPILPSVADLPVAMEIET
jgi:HAD superfamily hydrolase (TIGR01549 family)